MSELKIEKIENTNEYAKYKIAPFEKGFGHTFATPIRRVLLSTIKGFAISKIKVKGADHEFTALKGLKEDVLRLILNLQNVVFSIDGSESEKVVLKVKGPKTVTASDIKLPGNVTVLNPDAVIGELTDKSAELEIEATINSGYGFVEADDEDRNREPGIIPLNQSYSPVLKVNVTVESTRVGQSTDYEAIILEIWTNGAVSPDESLQQAVACLRERANQLGDIIMNM
jgi:DNA-directed RNA polymerase subunit alpha